jgi:hypothetical protein
MKKLSIYNIVVSIFLIYVLTFIHTYLSMNEYSNNESSACFGCSFIEEIIRYSLISLFFAPIFLLTNVVKVSKIISMILFTFFFITFLFLVNISIFDARVASWSTYTNVELWISVLRKMLFTGPFFGFIFYLYLKFFYFNSKILAS